ncbi:MAG: hypothetical protein OMM_00973 [Candidatus Magnetoglobus multicellularis str. Araruama]|uniref:Uncharacterized protein n=1 Tax=Candidatus Magnetoglobus multicellularis str. Araruama TaxID=890399 RepID=A0A1V1PF45_9BACT|nr:MAG: hypothetical protein OMM_00973 [Candidatus Magnetoglobus multicellularis str. Araruama]
MFFDKTGTLTLKQPYIKKIYTVNGLDENDILCKAAAAEYRQTHPIATAILDEANKRQIIIPDISQATYQVGYGITVQLGDQHIRVGSKSFMEMENIIIPDYIQSVMSTGHEKGHSFIFIASNNYLSGAIELAPQIRHEAQQVIQQFKQISLCIISGDDETPTRKLAKKLGIDQYYAGVLPEQKADLVKQLQDQGKKVCFVGDGINDSIALKTANVSVSIQGASMVALDSAQIVLMDNSLKNLPEIFRLAHDFKKNLKKSYVTVSSLTATAVGGVFLFNFEIPTVTILSSVSLCSCLIMSLLPGVKENKQSS